MPQGFASRCRLIRWSRRGQVANAGSQQGHTDEYGRIVLADDETIKAFDVQDAQWSATIEKAACNVGRITDVAFGHSSDELLVISDYGIKLTIWSLITCRGVEIRDPKYMIHCYDHRPRTGHLAVLTRHAAQDVLMLLDPGSHELIRSVELPTVDAKEVSWSPDGYWIAVRDVASAGHKVFIYTADGHLFKTYIAAEDGDVIGLGVKRIAWNAASGALALGDYNDRVTILSKNTVYFKTTLGWGQLTPLQSSPVAKFSHPSTIYLPQSGVWQEQITESKDRSYTVAPQPASPPTSSSLAKASSPTHGISILSFNADSTLIATKADSIPTTVWIWFLRTGKPAAVLIHHSPVKHISWHEKSDILLIHCAIPEPAVHLWSPAWAAPRIVLLPIETQGSRLEASWLQSSDNDSSRIMISSTHQYATARIANSTGELVPDVPSINNSAVSLGDVAGAEDMFDEGHSLDLSPIKIAHDETMEVQGGIGGDNNQSGSRFGMGNEVIDDTFHYRRHVKAGG